MNSLALAKSGASEFMRELRTHDTRLDEVSTC
jgi:hypothetical protein